MACSPRELGFVEYGKENVLIVNKALRTKRPLIISIFCSFSGGLEQGVDKTLWLFSRKMSTLCVCRVSVWSFIYKFECLSWDHRKAPPNTLGYI